MALSLLCLLAFVPGLLSLPPTDRDESLFAQASKQMVESGNYVDIRIQDKPRYQKPIGIYWLQAASVQLFQPDNKNSIWVYRLPSALGMTIAVLMTAALGSVLFTPTTGFIAALMLMGCTIVNVEARLATTDAALLAAITITQFALARAWCGSRKVANCLLFWTALGAGVLLKGPIILLPLVGTVLWLWWSEKKLGWVLNLRPLPGSIYLLLLASPWFIAISMASHGAFVEQSAGKDLLDKIWSGQNRGIVWPGFHLLIFPFMFFPASLFTYMALPDIWHQRKARAVAFCLGWIVPTWIVFELSLTKLTHYTMPTFPAFALLSAWVLVQGFPSLKSIVLKKLIATCWLLIGIAYAIAFIVFAFRFGGSLTSSMSWYQIVASIGLVICQAFGLWFFRHRNFTKSLAIVSLGSLIFMDTVFSQTLPGLSNFWISSQVVQKVAAFSTCPDPRLITVDFDEPSIVLLGGTESILLNNVQSAIEAAKSEPCAVAVVNERFVPDFIAAMRHETGSDEINPFDSVRGFNLGNGHWVSLSLFAMPVYQIGQ
ncbi:4-amino-4-deoxy-L-arabinose transferase-like glycosyltransferase [Agrobacterium vitis]|nr:4-amino-4-deoxy-L-arabinose transferase-like glycosyltransferase [Agrobacterium vitis]MBE1436326.1 4-amino-4-deoxy-L-arabinose transferase-like glycosyltransferase [Agrobacterium vitis]